MEEQPPHLSPLGRVVPRRRPSSVGVEEAEEALLRLYLRALGPATIDDAAWWTGLPKGVIRCAVERLASEITTARLPGRAGEYLIPGEEAARPREARPSSQHVVNILPRLDPLLMGYREREHLVDAESYGLVYDRSGNATSTILLDGRVAGVWDPDSRPGSAAPRQAVPLSPGRRQGAGAAREAGLKDRGIHHQR